MSSRNKLPAGVRLYLRNFVRPRTEWSFVLVAQVVSLHVRNPFNPEEMWHLPLCSGRDSLYCNLTFFATLTEQIHAIKYYFRFLEIESQ